MLANGNSKKLAGNSPTCQINHKQPQPSVAPVSLFLLFLLRYRRQQQQQQPPRKKELKHTPSVGRKPWALGRKKKKKTITMRASCSQSSTSVTSNLTINLSLLLSFSFLLYFHPRRREKERKERKNQTKQGNHKSTESAVGSHVCCCVVYSSWADR